MCAVIRCLCCDYLTIRGGLFLLSGSQRTCRFVVSALRGALSLLSVGERGIGSGLRSLCLVQSGLRICGSLLGDLDFLRRCVDGCLLGCLELCLRISCRLLRGIKGLRLVLGVGLGCIELSLGILQRGTGAVGRLDAFIELASIFGTRGGLCLRIIGGGGVIGALCVVAGRLLFGIGAAAVS